MRYINKYYAFLVHTWQLPASSISQQLREAPSFPKCAYFIVGGATPFELNPPGRWFVSGDPPGVKVLSQLNKTAFECLS